MKFCALVAILAEEMEDKAIDVAKEAGAGSVTLLAGRGLTASEKKTFFGLTYEGNQSVLLFVLERRLSLIVLKALTRKLGLEENPRGVAFTIPLEHLGGIDVKEIGQFEAKIKKDL